MPSAPNSLALAASSGVSAFARTRSRRSLVGPREDGLEVLVHPRRDERHRARDDAPAAAVDRQHVSFGELAPVDHRRSRLERERVAAGHGRLAHPACDDGRVGRHAAVRGQDAARPDEAVDVVRRRLPPHEDDVFPVAAALLGRVRVEDDAAGRRARRGVQALGDHLDLGRRGRSSDGGAGRAGRGRCATTASSREISPSAAMSTAIRSAAAAVRFPVRVCRR